MFKTHPQPHTVSRSLSGNPSSGGKPAQLEGRLARDLVGLHPAHHPVMLRVLLSQASSPNTNRLPHRIWGSEANKSWFKKS